VTTYVYVSLQGDDKILRFVMDPADGRLTQRHEIEVSVFGQPADPEVLKAYEDAGATRAMVFADSARRDDALRQLDDYARRLLA